MSKATVQFAYELHAMLTALLQELDSNGRVHPETLMDARTLMARGDSLLNDGVSAAVAALADNQRRLERNVKQRASYRRSVNRTQAKT